MFVRFLGMQKHSQVEPACAWAVQGSGIVALHNQYSKQGSFLDNRRSMLCRYDDRDRNVCDIQGQDPAPGKRLKLRLEQTENQSHKMPSQNSPEFRL
jgi:hypothetical protein